MRTGTGVCVCESPSSHYSWRLLEEAYEAQADLFTHVRSVSRDKGNVLIEGGHYRWKHHVSAFGEHSLLTSHLWEINIILTQIYARFIMQIRGFFHIQT